MIDCFFPQAMRNQFRIRGKAMTSVTVAKKNKNDYGSFLLSNFFWDQLDKLENLHS